jgi:GAF domain-containing protein
MSTPEPHATDATAGLASLAPRLDSLVEALGVKSVLVMRSDPDSMMVAATAGEATRHYAVGGAGKKALDDESRVPLYCERVVSEDSALFVRDSRQDTTFAGNEDEAEFGLHNYLGLPVHDASGQVVGTVCVLDDSARDYSDSNLEQLQALRRQVETLVASDDSALG